MCKRSPAPDPALAGEGENDHSMTTSTSVTADQICASIEGMHPPVPATGPDPVVPLTHAWIEWQQRHPGTTVTRRDDGALIADCDAPVGTATIIRTDPNGNGYDVIQDDRRWPVTGCTLEVAALLARNRQRLRRLTPGPMFRATPCWLGVAPDNPATTFPSLAVSKTLAGMLGLATTQRRVRLPAHRVSFLVYRGRGPLHGSAAHACGRVRCANPDHLDDVSAALAAAMNANRQQRWMANRRRI